MTGARVHGTDATGARLDTVDAAGLADLLPLLRRAVGLDPGGVTRLRLAQASAAALIRLPFGVLVARTIRTAGSEPTVDTTVPLADAVAWLDGQRPEPPHSCDERWIGGLPPAGGWRRVETVPDTVVRGVVRQGALALKDAAAREGVPGAQPRAEVADALLDAVVLTADDERGDPAEVTLRVLSALTRMGFLPREGAAHVDVAGRWLRVVGGYGTVFAERPGRQLMVR